MRRHTLTPRRALKCMAALFALIGCDDDELNPVWRVDHLRVVAVLTDPPDAVEGETVHARLVTALPRGTRGDVSVGWLFESTAGQGDSFTFTAPAPGAAVSYTLGGFACNGVISLGPDGPSCNGGEGLAFVRSVRVRGAVANHNPRIARVSLDGAELTETTALSIPACPMGGCAPHTITVSFASDARDTIAEIGADGTSTARPESLISGYLVDAGELDGAFRSDNDLLDGVLGHENKLTAPAADGDMHLWITVRDGRGGFDAVARTLRVVR